VAVAEHGREGGKKKTTIRREREKKLVLHREFRVIKEGKGMGGDFELLVPTQKERERGNRNPFSLATSDARGTIRRRGKGERGGREGGPIMTRFFPVLKGGKKRRGMSANNRTACRTPSAFFKRVRGGGERGGGGGGRKDKREFGIHRFGPLTREYQSNRHGEGGKGGSKEGLPPLTRLQH